VANVVDRASRAFGRIPLRSMLAWLRPRAKRELLPLAIFFLAAAALFAFAEIAEDVMEGDTHAFDEALLHALRNPADLADPIGPLWIETAVRDVTSLGGTTILGVITLFALGYLVIDGKRSAALFVFIAVGGGAALSAVLKSAFARPRPELVAHMVEVYSLSFPSGHAMASAVTYLTLGALLTRLQSRRRLKAYLLAVAVTLTLLVGMSRVYLGVHWPTDVLAGWCAGAAWAMLCWLAASWLQRRGRIEQEGETR
jgi:undecaprenyl-diphosphatase